MPTIISVAAVVLTLLFQAPARSTDRPLQLRYGVASFGSVNPLPNVKMLADAGFDYIEPGLSQTFALSPEALAKAARDSGIEVPFITCWTHQVRGSTDPVLRQVFDACNFYPRWNVDGELNPNIKRLRA